MRKEENRPNTLTQVLFKPATVSRGHVLKYPQGILSNSSMVLRLEAVEDTANLSPVVIV
jgi:hypothetical protein